jgi:site-specific recombinase XerD
MDEYKLRNYTLNRIDLKFLETFFQYLRVKKNTCHNTSLKYIAIIKASLRPLLKAGIIKGDPFSELKIKPKPVHVDFLTQEELNKIIFTDLNDPILERKKDIFLFACYTGLSFIDLTKLKSNSLIQDPDGSWYIRTSRQKTGEECIIPLLPPAERILKKYSFSNDLRDFQWHITSNQKMNKGLKRIGSLCDISKPLHMHLARHTFATTVTLTNGVPIESVSKMLGHANIRTTQHYAKVVGAKIKDDMFKIRGIYK